MKQLLHRIGRIDQGLVGDGAAIGALLALAMLGTLFVAAVMGTLIPLFLRWLKIDPALASSVFVTTATDVTGFLLFLGLGSFVLARF